MASIDMELVMISQYKQRWPEETVTEEMAAVYDQIVGRGFTTPGGVDGAKVTQCTYHYYYSVTFILGTLCFL